MKQRTLELTPQQKAELIHIRDHDKRAYLRERAAALLKIAEGFCAHWIAQFGLLKPRDPDTIYSWLNAYQAQGQLPVRKATRRRFSP